MATPSLSFTVHRQKPVLVAPAEPTPNEFKRLSDIDDQEGLRFYVPVIQFYRYDPSMAGKDPAKVIREAVAKALVFYYPLAGRLREGPGRKLSVECTGEGVVFIEADADVRLEDLGDALQPPFPYLEELLFEVEGSGGVLNCPLLVIQVTRLSCGGFIFAISANHTMTDATGLVLFMSAVGELARGARAPSVTPVWGREVLEARPMPSPTHDHREFHEVAHTKGTIIPLDDMAHRSFFFGRKEIAALRRHVPAHLCNSTTFEILTACLWKCRTVALGPDPDEPVRIIFAVNARAKFSPPLPAGYYGNGFALPAAVARADQLCANPLGYALELVRKAKREVTADYMRSVADLMVLEGRPHFTMVRSFVVSDVTRAGFRDVDLGWGKAVYGGPPKGGVGAIPGLSSFYIAVTNTKGEDGIVVPVCLPGPVMEKFVVEMENLTAKDPAPEEQYGKTTLRPVVVSAPIGPSLNTYP